MFGDRLRSSYNWGKVAHAMDAYDRTAKLQPLLLLVAPGTLYLAVLIVSLPSWWQRLLSALGLLATGLPLLATQLVADRGKEAQKKLWKRWEGRNTTLALRWAGAENIRQVERRHEQITRVTGIQLPSREVEAADPQAADDLYEVATDDLKELTRDHAKHPGVFRELTIYGFRRNLFGIRVLGRVVSIAGVIACAVTATIMREEPTRIYAFIAAGVACLAFAAFWWFFVTETFVKRGGERYADRLIASATTLGSSGS